MSGPVFLPPGVKVFVPNFDKYIKFFIILSVSRVFTLKGQIKYFVFMKRKKQDLKNIAQMDSNFYRADLLCPAKHQPPLLLK